VLVGTSLIARTNADGRYTLSRGPAGPATVRAPPLALGRHRNRHRCPAKTAVVDLSGAVAVLAGRSGVTSTGDQAKKQVGTSIATIDVAKLVQTSPITT